ncbi:MAG: hypothetical protein FJX25_04945 [Alphaproteobacteria bacterium]|nr:hypothetical protein [Alphaproteobacteria bacterium]
MIRALILLLLLPVSALAEPRPPTGLLRNDSALPATIPLQVRAPEGQDQAVILTDVQGRPVISGYLRGGSALRLLVPPGDHHLTVVSGPASDWRGLDEVFGPDTQAVALPQALRFRIEDNRREGHSITLIRDGSSLRLTDRQDRVICQVARWDLRRKEEITSAGTRLRWLDPQLEVRSRPCD